MEGYRMEKKKYLSDLREQGLNFNCNYCRKVKNCEKLNKDTPHKPYIGQGHTKVKSVQNMSNGDTPIA